MPEKDGFEATADILKIQDDLYKYMNENRDRFI